MEEEKGKTIWNSFSPPAHAASSSSPTTPAQHSLSSPLPAPAQPAAAAQPCPPSLLAKPWPSLPRRPAHPSSAQLATPTQPARVAPESTCLGPTRPASHEAHPGQHPHAPPTLGQRTPNSQTPPPLLATPASARAPTAPRLPRRLMRATCPRLRTDVEDGRSPRKP